LPELDLMLLENRVDALLAGWREQAGPGVTIGVVQEGRLAVHRSAGLANIEHRVPIGPQTRFRIASVSKQFTTSAVLMLAHEGRLGLEDKAAEHLPELGLDGRITLAHLMHNTSGLRDMLELMRQGGADLGTPVTQAELLEAIGRQRRLNFDPGTRYLYSNTNFLLLGLIAEHVSGQPLPEFLEERIFAPLGMTATLMTPDVHVSVPDLATGYRKLECGWARAPHAFPVGGEGGLVSCVRDLALWDRNLDTGRVGGDWLASALRQQTPFTNGMENRYARGQAVRGHRGLQTVSHGGLWPGYRTEFLRVPARRTTVIVIANAATAEPNLVAHQVLDAILDGDPAVQKLPSWPPREDLQPLAGRYVDPAVPATLDIAIPDRGAPTITTFGLAAGAEMLPDGRLAAARSNSLLAVRALDRDTIEVEEDAGATLVMHRAASGPLPDGLAGEYANEEMASVWTVCATREGGLEVVARGPVARGQPWPIEAVEGDVIRIHIPGLVWPAWYDALAVRGEGGVTGLLVHAGRVKQVLYTRK